LLDSLGPGNPGDCWVSYKCFPPAQLVNGWIDTEIRSRANSLTVFYNSVPVKVDTNGQRINAVTLIQRSPKRGEPYDWPQTLSEALPDWYSDQDSDEFTKRVIRLRASAVGAVVEATEWGEVLALSGANYRLGIEAPEESSSETLEGCGQCVTYPFYVGSAAGGSPDGWEPPKPDNTGGYSLGQGHDRIWTYRRTTSVSAGSGVATYMDEVSNQNWGSGNDYCLGPALVDMASAADQVASGRWLGGINVAGMAAAEDRALGWYHFYRDAAPDEWRDTLFLDRSQMNTATGLPRLPYVRDSRRAVGLGGFLLRKKFDMDTPAGVLPMEDAGPGVTENVTYAADFYDSVGLGNYLYADLHPLTVCTSPRYLNEHDILPYHIPFRALTSDSYVNLLVSGRSMATTFQAQTATRMHPSEFASGEAAGAAAATMAANGLFSTEDVLDRIEEFQASLEASGVPIFWSRPRVQ
jgi:hypothetical protein